MFFLRKKLNKILLVVLSSCFISCGGNDCKYPENKNGIWEDLNTNIVYPINKSVIDQINSYGAITLKQGATEARARSNLWTPLMMKNGNYALVEAGNKVRLDVSDSVILAGYLQNIPVVLKDWIDPTNAPYSFAPITLQNVNVNNVSPESIRTTTTWNADNSIKITREYTVIVDGDKTVVISDEDNPGIGSGSCQNISKPKIPSDLTINYGFLYPKKIWFQIFPTKDGGINANANLTITPNEHKLNCFIEEKNDVAFYVCRFTYSGTNWEYRRRVKPIMVDGYPQFEEQINNMSKSTSQICERSDKCMSTTNGVQMLDTNKLTYNNNGHYSLCFIGGNKATDLVCNYDHYPFDNIIYTESGLSNGYKQLTSVSDDGREKIDLNYKNKANTKIQMKYKYTQCSGGSFIGSNCATSSCNSDTTDWRFFCASDGYTYFDAGDNNKRIYKSYITSSNTIYETEIGNYYIKDLTSGNIIGSSNGTYPTNQDVFLFNGSEHGTIFYLKIYEGDQLVKDFVPCEKNVSNEVGLCDIISGKFHGFGGTISDISISSNENIVGSIEGNTYGSAEYKQKLSPIKFYFQNFNDVYSYEEDNVSIVNDEEVTTTIRKIPSTTTYDSSYLHNSTSYEYLDGSGTAPSLKNRFSFGIHNVSNGSATKLKHQGLCRVFPKRIKYKLNKYQTNGTDWLTKDNSKDPTAIEYCSRDCIDVCLNYFPTISQTIWRYTSDTNNRDGYVSNIRTSGNVLADSNFYYYAPVSTLPARSSNYTVGSTGCGCCRLKDLLDSTGDNTYELQKVITSACQKSDGWYGWYAKATEVNGAVLNYVLMDPVDVDTSLNYFTLVKFLRNYNNGQNYSYQSTCGGSNYKSYYLCSPLSVQQDKCDYKGLEQCNASNMGYGKCQGLGGFTFIASKHSTADFMSCSGSYLTCAQNTYAKRHPTNSTAYANCLTHPNTQAGYWMCDLDADRYCDYTYEPPITNKARLYECNKKHYECLRSKSLTWYASSNYNSDNYFADYMLPGYSFGTSCNPCVCDRNNGPLRNKQKSNIEDNNASWKSARECDIQRMDCIYDQYLLEKNNIGDSSAKRYCPSNCEIPKYKTDGSATGEVSTESFNVVSQIDYSRSNYVSGDRVGYESSMGENGLFYEINNGNTIPTGDIDLVNGLLPLGSPEVLEVECADIEPEDGVDLYERIEEVVKIPDNSSVGSGYGSSSCPKGKGRNDKGEEIDVDCDDNTNSFFKNVYEKMRKKKGTDTEDANNQTGYKPEQCQISGTFKTYSTEKGDNRVKFNPQTEGIIPIQWSAFSVQPGDSIPITISVAGSGTYPIQIKSGGGGGYIEMSGGNGLAMYVQPNQEEIPSASTYAIPDDWQCNMGTGGSYGFYKPYKYNADATSDWNGRKILTYSILWWYCDNPVAMWFSGYDYTGIKTGTPFSMHKYSFEALNSILPNYTTKQDTSVSALGCNADGVPTSIVLSNGSTITKDKNNIRLLRSEYGAQYQYTNDAGELVLIDANDATKISSKIFSQYAPEQISIDAKALGLVNVSGLVTIKKSRNGLKRVRIGSNGVVYKYQFKYISDVGTSKDFSQGDDGIDINSYYIGSGGQYLAQCLESAGEETQADETFNTQQPVNSIEYDVNSHYYYSSDDGKTIYTRLGPFSGFGGGSTTTIFPAIYSTKRMCMNDELQFIYDEQDTDHSEVIEQNYNHTYWDQSAVKRENLERSWRVEFGDPDKENGKNNYDEKNNDSYATFSDSVVCGDASVVPDIMIVDLNKATPKKNKKVLLYKNQNDISQEEHQYRNITCPAVGWNNEIISVSSSNIACKFDGYYDSCSNDVNNGMILEVYKNGVKKECKAVDGDVKIGNIQTDQFYKFTYDDDDGAGAIEYQIPKSNVNTDLRICFPSQTRNNEQYSGWLKDYFSNSFILNQKHGSLQLGQVKLISLGRAPYVISCGDYASITRRVPYGGTDGSANASIDINLASSYMDNHNDTNELNGMDARVGVLMNYGLSFLNNEDKVKYFARCVPNWKTSNWMLLNRPQDPSSFEHGFSAVSGAYFSKPSESISWDSLKEKYAIDQIHAKFGGMISNSIYNTTCNYFNTGMPNGCDVSLVSVNYPSFKAIYDRQIIMAKTLVNDIINTSDGNCGFSATSGEKSGALSIKMNEPFGEQLSATTFNRYSLDKSASSGKISGVSNTDIGNGDGRRGNEFFKHSEVFRNIIGAGIVAPHWWLFNDSDGNPTVFEGGKKIAIKPSSKTKFYYASGNLSHASRGYCVNSDEDYSVASVEGWWGASLVAYGFGAIGIGLVYLFLEEAISAANEKNLDTGGFINIERPSLSASYVKKTVNHDGVAYFQPSNAKRMCGVGTAFRVLPIPHFACFNGYKMRCSNERINKWVDNQGGGTDSIFASKCISGLQTDYQANTMPVGQCYKQKYNISGSYSTGEKEYLRYREGKILMNNLMKATPNWDSSENVLEEHCGVCIKKDSVIIYNGVAYGTTQVATMNDIFTRKECNNITDKTTGERFTFVKQLAILTDWDSLSTQEQEEIFGLVSLKFKNKLQTCDPTIVFEPTLSNDTIKLRMKTAYNKIGSRNKAECISAVESIYEDFLGEAQPKEECNKEFSSYASILASASCDEVLLNIQNRDGDEYSRYVFIQNASTAQCSDEYNPTKVKSDKTGLYSAHITKSKKDMIEKYGFTELSSDVIVGKNDSVSFNIDIPKKIKGKTFRTANIGFVFIGKDEKNPMKMYTDYRVQNENDLKRGYNVQIGSGTPIMRGKYLYLYWQPLLSSGEPDPSYDPNVYFSSTTPNFEGRMYMPAEVIKSNLVYDFKKFDVDDIGTATFTSPRTGKLWAAVIDAEVLDSKGRNTDELRDGKYIVFKAGEDQATAKVEGDNYLGSNSGQYYINGSIQTDSLDAIDSIVKNNKNNNYSITKTLFSWLIGELKELLIGKWEKGHIDETTGKYIPSGYAFEKHSLLGGIDAIQVPSGLMPQVASKLLKHPILHIFFWMAAVAGMFALGLQVLFGSVKIDFKFLTKYVWSYAIMIAFLNPSSLGFYLRFFVRGAFNLADGLSAYVAGNFASVNETYDENDAGAWAAVAFGPVDKVITFFFNIDIFYRIVAILFSSITGWISVIILLMCWIHFMISALQALILYVMILLNMTVELMIGPFILIFLVHEKTRDIFDNWWKNIAGMIAEQVCLFTALSAFATLYYHMLKGAMNFIICWEPVIKIPILDITLFSCWKVAGTLPTHMAELMGEEQPGNIGGIRDKFSILTGITLLLIVMCMNKFIDKASDFGADLFGKKSTMPDAIKELAKKGRATVNQAGKAVATAPYKAAGEKIKRKISGEDMGWT